MTSVVKEDNAGVGFPCVGVSFRVLEEIREIAKATCSGKDANTGQVCSEIVKPETFKYQSSYADYLIRVGREKEVGKPTIFVSHAWSYIFSDLFSHIGDFEKKSRESGIVHFYWLDILTVNQHKASEYPSTWWSTTFKVGIESIGHTLLVLSPWSKPIPTTRAWCLWEMLCSISNENVEFEILLGSLEREQFRKALLEDWDLVENVMTKVDVETAEAFNPKDREFIFDAVRQTVGGFSTVNTKVKDQMRDWLFNEGKVLAEELMEKKGDETTDALINNVGKLMRQLGKYTEAYEFAQYALEWRTKYYGELHERTAQTFELQGRLQRDMGHYEESLLLWRRVLDLRESQCSAIPEDVGIQASRLEAMDCYASSLRDLSKLTEARELFVQCVDGCTALLGETHLQTLGSKRGLGRTLHLLGCTEEAEPILEQVHNGYIALLGRKHRDTIGVCGNLATCKISKGLFKEAEDLHRQILEARVEVLGMSHPHIFNTFNHIGQVIDKDGRHKEAETWFRKSLVGKEEINREVNEGLDSKYALNTVRDLAQCLTSQLSIITAASEMVESDEAKVLTVETERFLRREIVGRRRNGNQKDLVKAEAALSKFAENFL